MFVTRMFTVQYWSISINQKRKWIIFAQYLKYYILKLNLTEFFLCIFYPFLAIFKNYVCLPLHCYKTIFKTIPIFLIYLLTNDTNVHIYLYLWTMVFAINGFCWPSALASIPTYIIYPCYLIMNIGKGSRKKKVIFFMTVPLRGGGGRV